MTTLHHQAEAGGDGPGMVIIGAGQTGGRAAETLRDEGWRGPIVLVGLEDREPYERPPLSKAVLAGEKAVGDCAIFRPGFFAERQIDLRLGVGAREIRAKRQEVVLTDGSVLRYYRLLLATGAEPVRLDVPGTEKRGVGYLRSAHDAEQLAARLGAGRRIVVAGGGFIGLEAAAGAALRGSHETVVEAGPRLVMRSVPPEIERRLAARHRAAGVDVRVERRIAAIHGDGVVTGVTLDDGDSLACDALLIGVGIVPRVELAEAAGLAVDNGVAVDRGLRTSDPKIFAAGDVCSFPHALFDARVRLESWKNADDQGRLAARNMLGRGESYDAVPWLWSDQYEMTIQVAGLTHHGSRSVERPLAADALLIFHLAEDGRMVAASGIGLNGVIGRSVRLGQMMIERRLYPDAAMLADPSVNLKLLLAAEAA
jgi:3-phenylpropionate/trans-cinnamate dioxygenase ferredoxin reductase subunit